MGQAKQRGTFEQRKAAAEDRDYRIRAAHAEIAQRRASPKHVDFVAAVATMLNQKAR